MTGPELSRRSFVKGGGAVIVALALPARARADPGPDLGEVDSYLAVHEDGTVTIATGRVELGQGTTTGLAMIVAEELDIPVERVRFLRHETGVTPNTGGTLGSSSIMLAGPRLRAAAATARVALRAGVPVRAPLRLGMPPLGLRQGQAPAKTAGEYRLVGTAGVPRVDIPAKVAGTYTYVHGIRVPGMLHGRIVRPFGQGAYGGGTATRIVSVDERSIRGIGNARVVRRGDFLGVVASSEVDAIKAALRLQVRYADPPPISGDGNLFGTMRRLDTPALSPARVLVGTGDVDSAVASAAHVVSATYAFDYQAHVPIGPSCAVADVTRNGAVVLANTQHAYRMRDRIAEILGLPAERIRVQYWEGASAFGNAPSRFDAGEAAAVMSQLAGAPVRLQYMRWDEHGWDNYSPATLTDVRGAVDAQGRIVALDFTALGIPEMAMEAVATSQHVGIPLALPGLGSTNTINNGTQYDIPNRRVTAKSLPLWDTFFKTSAMRGPLTPQTCFASEQLVDELAHAARMDPYLFRLKNSTTAQVNDGFGQWRDALTAVARLAGWQPRMAASRLSSANVVTGRGIAIGGFAGSQVGIVAEVTVNRTTGKVAATHLYAAQVAGLAVHPDGIANQLEGNLVMGASRALCEQVRFDRRRATSLDWSTYPILRFKDAPRVTTQVVQRADLASTGSGEPAQAPVAAAIANAVFDATGVRIREVPLTPGRVRAAIAKS